MRQAFVGAKVFDGETIRQGRMVLVEGGTIVAVQPEGVLPAGYEPVRLEGGLLSAGFIDLQVNGGGGVMFNDAPGLEAIATIVQAHRRFGTTGLLPTLITADAPTTARAIAAAQAARQQVPGCLGLHLEGPHLAPARKGAHRADLMRPLDDEDFVLYAEARRGLATLLITCAVEQATTSMIARLAKAGIIVSLGHSDAGYAAAMAAAEAGARGITHLFNAMSPLSHREPGLVGAALDCGLLSCGLIVDGHHVHPAAMRAALNAKQGPGRIFLVTDAMATVGSTLASFTLDGRLIERGDGRLTLADGTLAGADIDMMASVRNAITLLGASVEEALTMASAAPADFIGQGDRRGRIRAGLAADLVHIDDEWQVRRTWVAGLADEPRDDL